MIKPSTIFLHFMQQAIAVVQQGGRPFAFTKTTLKYLPILQRLAVPGRIMVERDVDGRLIWSPHPRPDIASAKSWAWIVAVRAGYAAQLLQSATSSEFRDYQKQCEAQKEFKPFKEATAGDDIIDLVAFSPDLSKCYGRLVAATPVLGYPQEPSIVGDQPVRVYNSIVDWLEDFCAGVVMVGDDIENETWLRECEALVCQDIKTAEKTAKQMRREHQGPRVLVASL